MQGENMKRLLYAIALTLLFGAFLAAQTRHRHGRHWGNNITVNTDAEVPGDACDDHFNVMFGDSDVFTAEAARTLAPGEFAGGLDVRAPQNGGVLVRGWDKNEVLVKACKAVAAEDDGDAKEQLDRIKLQIANGRVSVDGPPDKEFGGRWVVHFLVNVPRDVKLALDAHNGPIHLRNVVGRINAETVNGPVKIYRCSGEITAVATNGPISVDRSSGNIRIRAQNGPLDVQLSGTEWSGQGLDASVQNGPIKLHIPSNYRSGVEVSSRGYSPFRCASDACAGAVKDWDDRNKSVRFGQGAATVVRMSTVNGPVSIVSTMQ
jgi:DUF4097 and DUF4098 domain-containing protein YvlB